jgi:hypothetical protein
MELFLRRYNPIYRCENLKSHNKYILHSTYYMNEGTYRQVLTQAATSSLESN